jgi:ubiquinone/menaquinone biosynthesis C-methylase UbiE
MSPLGAAQARFRPRNLAESNDYVRRIFDTVAEKRDRWLRTAGGYHSLLASEYRYWIPPGSRVLEIGCGFGDLLAATEPETGVGIDLSPKMIEGARTRHPHPHLTFIAGDVESTEIPNGPFDAIILSDLVCFLYDIEAVLTRLHRYCHPRTRLLLNFHSRLWEPILGAASTVGLVAQRPVLNWVTREDVAGMLNLAGFEAVWTQPRFLMPVRIPLVAGFFNRIVANIWPFHHLCISSVVVARPVVPPAEDGTEPGVSVIVPCRNEAGNIPGMIGRIPKMGSETEVVFVEGGSSDDTWEQCQEAQATHPDVPIQVHQQTGRGKGDAVRLGFSVATQPVLMILDADLTVPPEELTKFYTALASGRVEFVNGSRLVYAMDAEAMRFLNLLGNKFFAWAFTTLLGQRIKDTLCGTKVLLKSDYERLAANRAYFGELDPFGDFDLLFGAAKLGLKIHDLPIRYRDRTYGDTNISRFSAGWLLLRMCWLALKRLRCR